MVSCRPEKSVGQCARCEAREQKIMGKRKRHSQGLKTKFASNEPLRIDYTCDVGMKSAVRTVCDFYKKELVKQVWSPSGYVKIYDEEQIKHYACEVLCAGKTSDRFCQDVQKSLSALLRASIKNIEKPPG